VVDYSRLVSLLVVDCTTVLLVFLLSSLLVVDYSSHLSLLVVDYWSQLFLVSLSSLLVVDYSTLLLPPIALVENLACSC
jgi:hypothetical protein